MPARSAPLTPAVPGEVRPASREETLPVALAAVVCGFIALIVCFSRGYMLLYGDAVAHLGIARRVLDSRNPGIQQLGGVWLPLPHLLMLPFVQKMVWWQNGLAGAWPSLLCYVAAVAASYRIARRLMPGPWALAATAFFGLNPNLLYLSTTAMSEPLFLALLLWLTLMTMECVASMDAGRYVSARRQMILCGALILAAVFTRYDGWILGAIVWCVLAVRIFRDRAAFARLVSAFSIFTLMTVAGPILWLVFNQHYFHDPLDFLRGPYSAAAIERRTTPTGAGHYPGWHSPAYALVLYLRTAQLDAAAFEAGAAVMAAALAGAAGLFRRDGNAVARYALVLWIPLPFYVYSVAYGSVPIFIPALWPHSFYNSRYGMEFLPALAIFATLAAAMLHRYLLKDYPLAARFLPQLAMALIAANTIAMMYRVPLVLKEAMVNSTTRIAFESAVANELRAMPAGIPILMQNSDHVGALEQAGIPLRQTINEDDRDSWDRALAAPSQYAAYVIAIAGDPVSAAVAAHPGGLTELTVLCTSGQPCARVYRSDIFAPGTNR